MPQNMCRRIRQKNILNECLQSGEYQTRDFRFALHLGYDTDQKYQSLSSRSTASSVEKYANLKTRRIQQGGVK